MLSATFLVKIALRFLEQDVGIDLQVCTLIPPSLWLPPAEVGSFNLFTSILMGEVWLCGLVYIIFVIVAVVGGIYALQRKNWGLSLAGSILAFLYCRLVGIPVIVLIALSKNEFE